MNANPLKENYIKRLRVLVENEVEQAEVLIAAKGFSQELQSMIEKVGRLQNEDLGPVVDQMRETYGNELADGFNNELDTSLQGILDSLKETQNRINTAVSDIADGRMAGGGMGGMDDMGMGMDPIDDVNGMGDIDEPLPSDTMATPGDDLDSLDDIGDEFGGDPAMAGPEDAQLGREMKEGFIKAVKGLQEARDRLLQKKAQQ